MKKILFINPPTPENRKITRNCDCASESKGNYLLQPFDFLYLTSKLPKEAEFRFIDAVADKLNISEALERILMFSPDLIVLSLVDLTWDSDFEFLKKLRNNHVNSRVLVFGDALVEMHNRIDVFKYADGIIENAYLFSIKDYLDRSEIVEGLSVDIEKRAESKVAREVIFKSFPKHEMMMHTAYRWPFAKHKKFTSIATNWGCPFSCTYCIDSIFPFCFRPYENLIDELKYISSLGIKEIVVTDKSFGHPRENVKKLLQGMRDLNFSWSTYIHPRQCDEELLSLMAKAGCHTIIIGIESDNEDHLKSFKRFTNESLVTNAIKNAHKFGIEVCGDFLIGLPNQKYDDVLRLISFSQKLDLDFASFNIAAPLPGSEIKKIAVKEGRMKETDHHYDSVGNFKVLRTNYLSETDLIKLRNLANSKFYLRAEILFKRLKNISTLEQLLIQIEEGIQLFTKHKKISNKEVSA